MEVAQAVEDRPIVVPEPSGDDEPGLVDLMAEAEAALPRWLAAIQQSSPISEEITAAMNRAAERAQKSDARGKGFAGRILALRNLARELDPLTTRLLQVGSDYASEVVNIDPGILTLIRAAESETIDDAEALVSYCELFWINRSSRAGNSGDGRERRRNVGGTAGPAGSVS